MKDMLKETMRPIHENPRLGYPLLAMMALVSLYWPYYWFHDLPTTAQTLSIGTINVPHFALWMLPILAIVTDIIGITLLASLGGFLGQRSDAIEMLRTASIFIAATAILALPLYFALAILNTGNLVLSSPRALFAESYFIAGVYLGLSCSKLMLQCCFIWVAFALNGIRTTA